MKAKLITACLVLLYLTGSAQTKLNGVTFGVGVGYNHLFKSPRDYFLSPDSNALRIQDRSRTNFVISSIIMIKFSKLASDEAETLYRVNDSGQAAELKWYQRFVGNISINLLEVNANDISFNKAIEGGLGLGYLIKDHFQIGLSMDLVRVRQLRNFIQDAYINRRIPNGNNDYFNALDESNNTLFYNKNYIGLSIKFILSLGNKKEGENKLQKAS